MAQLDQTPTQNDPTKLAPPTAPAIAATTPTVAPAATAEPKPENTVIPTAVVEPAHEATYNRVRNAEQFLGTNYTNGHEDVSKRAGVLEGGKAEAGKAALELSPNQSAIVEWKKDLNSWLDKDETKAWLAAKGLSPDELRLETDVAKIGSQAGQFDDKTESLTMAFQQYVREQPNAPAWASKVDGIVGPRTMRAMDMAMGRESKLLDEASFADALERSSYIEGFAGGIDREFLETSYQNARSKQRGLPKGTDLLPIPKDGKLGSISAWFESGNRGPGTISSGRGDYGGVSYGRHQLSSNAGSLNAFLDVSGYDEQFAGMRPGTPQFNEKWKELAKKDPEFAQAQDAYIYASHYGPQLDKLQNAGIDLASRGRAVQEAIYSTAVQYGPNSSVIVDALSGNNVAAMSDADIVNEIQSYKAANVGRHFRSSSYEVQRSVAKRIENERHALLDVARDGSKDTVG